MTDDASDRTCFDTAIVNAIEEYDADIFLYSGEIESEGYGKLVKEVNAHKNRKNVLLILVTNGGLANYGYQIARFLQKTYSEGEFLLWIPSYCKSAGTLVALGANKLLMDTFSELGPLDVQILKQDEIGTRKSGLLSRSSFQSLQEASFNLFEHIMLEMKRKSYDLISFKLAAEVSSNITGQLMSGVYGQISPDVVGSDYRDLQVAFEYGIRLAQYSKNAKRGAVRVLVESYPSHDFIIDDDEAREIFKNVDIPSDNLYFIAGGELTELVYNENPSGVVRALNPSKKSDQEHPNENPQCGGNVDPSPSFTKSPGMDENRTGDRRSDQQEAESSETPADAYPSEKVPDDATPASGEKSV